MHLTAVSATFRKQLSDGNYGTELAEVTLSVTLNESEAVALDGVAIANDLLDLAGVSVYAKLGQSYSSSVRRAITPPTPPAPPVRGIDGTPASPPGPPAPAQANPLDNLRPGGALDLEDLPWHDPNDR